MGGISGDKRVLSLSSQQGLQITLETLLDQLNRCQKALNEFLEVCMIFADPHIWCTCTVAVIDIATYPLEFQWIST